MAAPYMTAAGLAFGSRYLQTVIEGKQQLRPALLSILLLEGPRLGALLCKLGVVLPQLHQELVGHHGNAAVLELLEQALGCCLHSTTQLM